MRVDRLRTQPVFSTRTDVIMCKYIMTANISDEGVHFAMHVTVKFVILSERENQWACTYINFVLARSIRIRHTQSSWIFLIPQQRWLVCLSVFISPSGRTACTQTTTDNVKNMIKDVFSGVLKDTHGMHQAKVYAGGSGYLLSQTSDRRIFSPPPPPLSSRPMLASHELKAKG